MRQKINLFISTEHVSFDPASSDRDHVGVGVVPVEPEDPGEIDRAKLAAGVELLIPTN